MLLREPTSRRIQAVDRAAALLKAAAEAPKPQTLAELADATGLNRSTAWRLLLTLEHHGLVDRDPDGGRYVLGHQIARLAMRDGSRALVRRMRPALTDLAAESGMAAILTLPTPTEPVTVDQVDPPGRPEPNMVGWGLPLHATASGKLWLASLDEREREELLKQPLPQYTDKTLVDPERLRSELREIARSGAAVDRDEWDPGWSAVSVPILRDDRIAAMIGVMATSMRFAEAPLEETVAQVRRAAAAGTKLM
ncbi:MAG: IclR family transcriptional regulator [Solirubrobacteraceae bacterium]